MLIDLDLLDLSPHRPKGHVARPSVALLRRLRRHGVVELPVVRPALRGRYEVLTGSETVVACGHLGIEKVPCDVRTDLTDIKAAEIVADHAQIPASTNPLGFCEAVAAAIGRHPKRGAIAAYAREVGVSRAQVANALRLLHLPEEVLALIRGGYLSVGHGKAILAAPLQHQRRALAEQAAANGDTVAQTQATASALARGEQASPDEPPDTPAVDPDQARFENQVSDTLGCPFYLDGQGRAVINYFGDLDILDGVLQKLGYKEN